MVWRYNVDFARYMTTTVDPDTKVTLPTTRWFAHQIPADYVFGFSPANPNTRFYTSASAHWTADISPHGGLGITSFNINLGGGNYALTARNVVPHIAERGVRWAIMEWNPSLPVTNALDMYDRDMAMVEQYKPALIAPWAWETRRSPSRTRRSRPLCVTWSAPSRTARPAGRGSSRTSRRCSFRPEPISVRSSGACP